MPPFDLVRGAGFSHFLEAARDCRAAQHQVLRDLLDLNRETQFSRDHGIDGPLTAAEFRQSLPVSDFERFRPYVDAVSRGDSSALLGPRNELLMLALTSGTTSDAKLIPITRKFVSDYRHGWQVWGIRAYDDHPRMHHLNLVQFTSDYELSRSPGGVPCGNISGLVAAMQSRVVRGMYSVPYEVSRIRDAFAKRYASVRMALADRHVGLVTTANPSTLVQIAEFADEHRETIVRDIHDGTLSPDAGISPELRSRTEITDAPGRSVASAGTGTSRRPDRQTVSV